MENDDLLKKRLCELSARAERGVWSVSQFLTVHEQSVLAACRDVTAPYELIGGTETCERRMAVFGSEELCGYAFEPPVACVLIEPRNEKFASELSHRDYLGALMALGIKRETLGDIFTDGSRAYVFCTETVGRYIVDSLIEVGRTVVSCSEVEPNELPAQKTEIIEVNVPSERADAVVGAVWRLSRGESSKLFSEKKVAIDSAECTDPSKTLKAGQRVSVRGFGKFIYAGEGRQTKKGRFFVTVEKLV